MSDSNELFDKLKADFQAALDRETSIRVNYEQGLIPALERDLQSARTDVALLTTERDELLSWKKRSDAAWVLVERAAVLTTEALDAAPSAQSVSAVPSSADGPSDLPPSWR